MGYEQELKEHYRLARLRIVRPKPEPLVLAPMPVLVSPPVQPTHNGISTVTYPESFGPFFSTKFQLVIAAQGIARKHGVDHKMVLSKCRKWKHVRPRHELFYYLVGTLRWNLVKVSQRTGFDHTTVLSGLRSYSRLTGQPLPPPYNMQGRSKFGIRPENKLAEYVAEESSLMLPGLAPRFGL